MMEAEKKELEKLFLEYQQELRILNGGTLPFDERFSDLSLFQQYYNNIAYHWFPVKEDDKIIGFFIVCDGNCFHNSHIDFEIAEAYVLPEYRRKGFMTKALSFYMDYHMGIYMLLVLLNNFEGYRFWRHFFDKKEYRPVWIPRPLGFPEDFIILGYSK